MYNLVASIGEHRLRFVADSPLMRDWICSLLKAESDDICGAAAADVANAANAAFAASAASAAAGGPAADLTIYAAVGYGRLFDGYEIEVMQTEAEVSFARADYRICVDHGFTEARLFVFDEFAFHHAMLHLFSNFIVQREWGLLIHSSCIVERERAYLFAGPSGAGKSTVARLSAPRTLFSDEASLVKIGKDGILIYDSPFRSDSVWDASRRSRHCLPAGIHFLRQSEEIRREDVPVSTGFIELMEKVFYWSYTPGETSKAIRLCRQLVQSVPLYRLYFQENSRFWEALG